MKKLTSILMSGLMLMTAIAFSGCDFNQGGTPTPTPTPTPKPSEEIIDDDVNKTPAPVIEVEGGQIQGYISDDETVRVYKGIPYAEAERFKKPTVTHWDGVKDCTDWGASCIQAEEKPMAAYTSEFMGSSKIYSENCLNLNIWTANEENSHGEEISKKPVIVYYHGGGFTAGNASCKVYEGKGVAQKGAVYVSVNYRLGFFGFYVSDELVAEDKESAGNYGILDAIEALRWVRDNISQFGGDPDNVTIMGQSAGAGVVNQMTVSPKAKGLFKRIISMSHNSVASSMFNIETQADHVQGFKDAIKQYELPEKSLSELRELKDTELYTTYQKIWFVDNAPLEPCRDGSVIPMEHFSEVLASGKANPVDVMVGTTSHDLSGNIDGISKDDQIDAWTGETALFAYAHALGKYEGKKAYTYIFNHTMPGKKTEGAFHTSDVPYFLNIFTNLRKDYWKQEDFDLGDTMSDYLVNFAKTGNPNGEGLTEWHANTSTSDKVDYGYMLLDVKCEEKKVADKNIPFIEAQYKDRIDNMKAKQA